MRNLKISLCSYPTTVVFVDDNQDYLLQLQGRFNELLPSITFDDPSVALQYLNGKYQQETFIQRCTKIPKDNVTNHFESVVDISLIKNPSSEFNSL